MGRPILGITGPCLLGWGPGEVVGAGWGGISQFPSSIRRQSRIVSSLVSRNFNLNEDSWRPQSPKWFLLYRPFEMCPCIPGLEGEGNQGSLPSTPQTHTPFPYLSLSGPKYLQEFQLQRKQLSYLVLSVQHALKCSPWNQGYHDLEKCCFLLGMT